MATRTDVNVDFIPSPRIAEVGAPSTEFIAQDIVDTLRIREESWRGQSETKLLDASGKENLGGGVQVGITTSLQDTQIAFESRTTAAQIGIATSTSSAPVGNIIDLYDTSATFQTNGIARGSLVINFTDQSIAEVYSVESETQIRTRTPVNGTSNAFNINDAYQVFNIIQCEISGGNVVAVDENGADISPILPTAFTQIVRTSSSSATLQNQQTLEFATFGGGVHVDIINGVAGTTGIIGNEQNPVNNIPDAKIIAAIRGFKKLHLMGDVTIVGTESISGLVMHGKGSGLTTLTVLAGATTTDTTYRDLHLVGDISGSGFLVNCHLSDVSGLGCTTSDSTLHGCILNDAILTLRADNIKNVNIFNSGSGNAAMPPTLDINGSVGDITIHAWHGEITIKNMTGGNSLTFGSSAAHVIIDSTCTNGTVEIRGTTLITDNSGAGCTIIDETVPTQNNNILAAVVEMLKYSKNRTYIDPIAYTLTIYEDDDTTVLRVFDLKDENGVASITSIFERLPQ